MKEKTLGRKLTEVVVGVVVTAAAEAGWNAIKSKKN